MRAPPDLSPLYFFECAPRAIYFRDAMEQPQQDIVGARSRKRRVSDGADDFPYKRLRPEMAREIETRFRALAGYRPTFRALAYTIKNAPEMALAQLRFCFAGARDPLIMVLAAEDYARYNLISDYFIEKYRVRAVRGDDPARESVWDYWRANRDDIMARARKNARAVTHAAREIIYREKMEVGTFRPTVACGIIWLLRARMSARCDWILNPCAGWGDRLIGFMAAGARGSVDIDPNAELGAEYPRMREWCREQLLRACAEGTDGAGEQLLRACAEGTDGAGEQSRASDHRFQHTYFAQPFEDVPREEILGALARMRGAYDGAEVAVEIARDDGFDLALIAPPYFDLEIYVPNDTARTQSVSRYTSFEEWYARFLLVALRKCGSLLRIGGVLALIINQSPPPGAVAGKAIHHKFLQRMIGDMARGAGDARLRYLGVISYAEILSRAAGDNPRVRSPQPIWIWQRERI
jgi:hypothetical protein